MPKPKDLDSISDIYERLELNPTRTICDCQWVAVAFGKYSFDLHNTRRMQSTWLEFDGHFAMMLIGNISFKLGYLPAKREVYHVGASSY